MAFDHPLANRSWITYEVGKDRSVYTILYVEAKKQMRVDDPLEIELVEAILEFMKKHKIHRAVGHVIANHEPPNAEALARFDNTPRTN